MTDETPADKTTSEPTTSDETSEAAASDEKAGTAKQPARRPTAAASAASRARRIGGARSAPAPTSAPADDTASTPAAAGEPATSSAADATPEADDKTDDNVDKRADDGADGKDRAVVEVPAWLRWVPAAVLSACAIAMLVLILVAAHGVWYSKPSGAALRDQVLASAKTCTAAANTYSYQTLPKDEARGLACSTGLWSTQYRRAIEKIVTPAATKLKASQSIQINNAGIEAISGNGRQWTVIVYGQTKITQGSQKARLDPFSAEVTMQHVGSKWLISKIDTIVNPSGS